jgi:hypothetical protein
MSSILKNTTKADREKIYVACNRVSIYENPVFFHNHIRHNFKLIDSTTSTLNKNMLEKYYCFTGEPADQLYSGSISTQMMITSPDDLTRNCLTDPDNLIDYIKNYTDKNFAEWWYSCQIENIKSVDIPIETYCDFFWWMFFNNAWISAKIRHSLSENNSNLLNLFFKNLIPWYESNDYQQWSMNNQSSIKYGNNTLGEYKIASKKYIYDVDHNNHYLQFKTKSSSISRVRENFPWFCLLDDYSTLSIDKNLEAISELLPTHLN